MFRYETIESECGRFRLISFIETTGKYMDCMLLISKSGDWKLFADNTEYLYKEFFKDLLNTDCSQYEEIEIEDISELVDMFYEADKLGYFNDVK